LGKVLEAFWTIFGGLGRLGRGLKKNKKSKPNLKVKKEGKFTWWGGVGGGSAAWRWTPGKEDLGSQTGC